MGYTHHWSNSKLEGIENALPLIQDIMNRYKNIVQYESDNPSDPIVNSRLIRFNGKAGQGYETFYFDGRNGFCKTGRAGYDIVVCECLIVLNHFIEDLKLFSDGFYGSVGEEPPHLHISKVVENLDGEWKMAIANVKEHYDISYQSVCTEIQNGSCFSWELEETY